MSTNAGTSAPSADRQSHPTAPITQSTGIASSRPESQASTLTYPSAATLVASSDGPQPTFRDALERKAALKFKPRAIEPSTTTTANNEAPEEQDKDESKRNCTAGLEFDFTYSNVYASGSRHGRTTVGSGSGAPSGCGLM